MKGRWKLPLALAALILALGLLERRQLAEPPHRAEWLAAGDVKVRAVRLGRGDTTLVLLHGYGESLMSWQPVAVSLARKYRVVALDLPGFGASDKPDGPYTLAAMQARLGDFLARWTEGPLVVIGHSMGGELAAALAIAEPRIVGAVLVAPAGYGLGALADSAAGSVGAVAGAMAPLVIPIHDPGWLGEPDSLADYDPVLDPAYHHSTRAVLEQFDFAALRDGFGSLRKPVLLLWGRQDPTIPAALGEAISAALPCDTFVPLDGMLHRPHQAAPDRVIAEIEQFLSGSHACDD
ncbi:MAG TPA: alpha/beta fold hydrolase [Gemmatimonadales bacterium]